MAATALAVRHAHYAKPDDFKRWLETLTDGEDRPQRDVKLDDLQWEMPELAVAGMADDNDEP